MLKRRHIEKAWQSDFMIFSSFLRWSACLATMAMIGDNKPLPLGMPKAACISWPWHFCNCLMDIKWYLLMEDNSLHGWSCFSMGRVIDWLVPLIVHPSISFVVAQQPSPCKSFFKAMGSSSCFFVMVAGWKIQWMPWRTAYVKWSSCCWDWICAKARKSSM